MATLTPRYQTVDGKEFKTKELADMHELGIKLGPQLDEYFKVLDSRAVTERGERLSRARRRKNLLHFLAWQQAQATKA